MFSSPNKCADAARIGFELSLPQPSTGSFGRATQRVRETSALQDAGGRARRSALGEVHFSETAYVLRSTTMFTLGEKKSRSVICSRLGIAWTRAAVVRAVSEDGYAIMIHEDDKTYINVPDLGNKRLTMQGRDDVPGDLIEQQDVLIRLFFRFNGQDNLEYLGRVRCVGHAAWGTSKNPARIFELIDK